MYVEDKELDLPGKIDKRSFLGSVIGLFTAVNLPWIAAKSEDKPIIIPDASLLDWKNFIRLTNGVVIQGSGVKDIDNQGNLILHDIMATQQLNVAGSILWFKNKLISNSNFNGGNQCLCNGDTLKITHNISFTLHDYNDIIKPNHPDWDYFLNKKFPDANYLYTDKKFS